MRPGLLYGLLALLLAAVKLTHDHGQRRAGALEERLKTAERTAAALARSTRTTDTVYRRDTLRLTRREVRWRDSVVARVDTLADTVRVPVEIVRWVVAEADSVISSCRAALSTCELRISQRDSLIANLRQQVRIHEQAKPSRLKQWGERALWAVALSVAVRQ